MKIDVDRNRSDRCGLKGLCLATNALAKTKRSQNARQFFRRYTTVNLDFQHRLSHLPPEMILAFDLNGDLQDPSLDQLLRGIGYR